MCASDERDLGSMEQDRKEDRKKFFERDFDGINKECKKKKKERSTMSLDRNRGS